MAISAPPTSTARGHRRFLRAFTVGVVLSLLPLVVVGARFAVVGEFDLFDTDASLLEEQLHGPLSESFLEYKLAMTENIKPDVLVLGSSSVMQFRDSFLSGCTSRACFYNAGGAAPTMRAAQEFFTEVSAERAPRVLLLGVDILHFNPNDTANTHQPATLRPSQFERAAPGDRDPAAIHPSSRERCGPPRAGRGCDTHTTGLPWHPRSSAWRGLPA